MISWLKIQWLSIKNGLKSDHPMQIGKSLTKAFGAVVLILVILPQKVEDGWSWRAYQFLISPANEIGDALAGVAGTLAFLWIIVTVMLQSKELAAQREELRLARQESAKMVAALEAQTDIFRDEQKQRDEIRAKELLEEMLKGLFLRLRNEIELAGNWFIKESAVDGLYIMGGTIHLFPRNTEQSLDDYIANSNGGISNELLSFRKLNSTNDQPPKSSNFDFYQEIQDRMDGILALNARLGEDQKTRVANLNIADSATKLGELLSMEIWND